MNGERHAHLGAVPFGAVRDLFESMGHPIELGYDFQEHVLPEVLRQANALYSPERIPWLAALVCCSAFDLPLSHDAYGQVAPTAHLRNLWTFLS